MARENKRKRDEKRFGKAERLIDLVPRGDDGWDGIPIEATNISDYYLKYINTHTFFDLETDIPCARPPFSEVFVEMARSNLGGMRVGWRLQEIDPEGDFAKETWANGVGVGDFGLGWTDAVRGILFLGVLGSHPFATRPIAGCVYHLDTTGRLARTPQFAISDGFLAWFDLPEVQRIVGWSRVGMETERPDCFSFVRDTLIPILLALSFMHCKNVALEPVEPAKEINRERKKAGLKPFVRYHTINIDPMKKVLRTEGNIEVNGLRKALHIVRGHFTHYSEERPLFGRPGLHGTFWTPAHTRGSLDEGIVVSDYNVKAPANP